MLDVKSFQVDRPWGNFRQFVSNTPRTVKIVTVKPGEAFSLQHHAQRSEFWRVIAGHGVIQIGEDKFDVAEGGEYNIPPGVKHRAAAGPSGLVMLEISTEEFDEEDIVRLEDKYGRA